MNNKINKEELARQLWNSAVNMRGSLEQNDHKNFLLAMLFYKFLSQKQVEYFKKEMHWMTEPLTFEQIQLIDSAYINPETELIDELNISQDSIDQLIEGSQSSLGFYIQPKYLFENWINQETKFGVELISDSIKSFNTHLSTQENIRILFDGIFNVYESELGKLGQNPRTQSENLKKILNVIKDIPTGKQDFDVLGFVYQYMVEQFAGEAGKKGGEYYTPHEVSQLMSEIVARHFKNRENISVYDPTSGSGSLLITIGDMFAKYSKKNNNVTYYAQEKVSSTYTITRMNLIMHGINSADINVRNGDTLKRDWPFFTSSDESTYELRATDAVVSNPPYSLKWDAEEAHGDPRFIEYGIAPKSKADYAFLLHSLYHLKEDGIMTIVLPHGVLFRGASEGLIRQKLIEKGYIDTIIGLPAGIFFRTCIATIIMVLRKNKHDRSIQFIDASKLFNKTGATNRMEISHIRKVVDAYINKSNIDKFSRIVHFDEIKENDFNLNISRYIDAFEKPDYHDLYASLHGGVPNSELMLFDDLWLSLPNMKKALLKPLNNAYSEFVDPNQISEIILGHADTQNYLAQYEQVVDKLQSFIKSNIGNLEQIKNIAVEELEETFDNFFFDNISQIRMLDKYELYQEAISTFKDIKKDLYHILANIQNSNTQWYPDLFKKTQTIEKTYLAVELEEIQALQANIDEYNTSIKEIAFDKESEESLDDNQLAELNELKVNLKNTKEILKKQQTLFDESLSKIIKNITPDKFVDLLHIKWSANLTQSILDKGYDIINEQIAKLEKLAKKYAQTLAQINDELKVSEQSLVAMLKDLKADEYDLKAIKELVDLLGDNDE
ncbi:type I restriction-modification system subunit M [Ureaplasma miroungigenitalium]|uniref:type I restriction-modification system subunit M n=1 Tax=Ureaplasma miroungigenitalium TaxID=1042321 RepID=UPI0021E9AE3D|nr:type I restriction-modification system subunit M [Ureaplasma miroungigenitalium]MCV3734548.1 type I restriction-modification system subunit M [Ureaplasma miroungigenitalium]